MAKKGESHEMVHTLIGVVRIALGWIFFWPFLDKVFGLGFATESGKAWIDGVSPTMGFLKFGTQGPFADAFQALAGNALVDWLFMIGLLCIGLALIFGVGVKIAAGTGTLLLMLMWLAALLPEHNPFLDDHIVYSLVLLLLAGLNAGDYLGFGKQWKATALVKKNRWLA